jgi:urea carboxylase
MSMRYSFGGDEHLFVECSEEMSLEAFFTSLSMTNGIRDAAIKGVTEICPANASFQIKFDPDVIHPDDIMKEVKAIESAATKAEPVITTRIIEIPVFYNDPWTHETLMRFRERHQDPSGTDLDYAARVNNFGSVDDFIAAHAGSPWFVSMVGFVSGLPFMYQMVERQRQIEVPKYLRPRTDTPRLTVGHGGCFGCIYSVRGAGGYQMFGITPMPIYDPTQTTSPQGFHGVLPAGRHRQVQAGGPGRLRPGGRGRRQGPLHPADPEREVRPQGIPERHRRHQCQAGGRPQWPLRFFIPVFRPPFRISAVRAISTSAFRSAGPWTGWR